MGTKRAFCNPFVHVTFLRLGLGVGMEGARLEALASLRAEIARLERGKPISEAPEALPFGVAAIDAQLPADGLLLGAMHELQAAGPDTETGAAPALFAAGILARRPGTVVWIGRETEVFAAGLLDAGLDPRRVVFVDAGKYGAAGDGGGAGRRRRGRRGVRAGGPARPGDLASAAAGGRGIGGAGPADPPVAALRRSRAAPAVRGGDAVADRRAAVPGGAGACAGHPWAEPAAVAAGAAALPRG